jgi:serine/threonine protein phosphatase PrpC
MQHPEIVIIPIDLPTLCVVADGMGGNNSGKIASQYVVARLIEESESLQTGQAVVNFLQQVNDELYDQMMVDISKKMMGTTISGVVFAAARAIVFNVGDSRVYIRNNDYLRQLSVDDTRNVISNPGLARMEADARKRKDTRLTQAIGGADERLKIMPHCVSHELEIGQRFLICSDGVSDSISLDILESCVGDDDIISVNTIFKHVINAGGEDNISVIIASIKNESE